MPEVPPTDQRQSIPPEQVPGIPIDLGTLVRAKTPGKAEDKPGMMHDASRRLATTLPLLTDEL